MNKKIIILSFVVVCAFIYIVASSNLDLFNEEIDYRQQRTIVTVKEITDNPKKYGGVKVEGKLGITTFIMSGKSFNYIVDEEGYKIRLTHLPDSDRRSYEIGIKYEIEGRIGIHENNGEIVLVELIPEIMRRIG